MKSPSTRLPAALVSLAILALAAPILRSQIALYGEADAHLERGAEYLRLGRADGAEEEWRKAARLTPRNPNVYHALGSLYLAQGRWEAARHALHRLADLAPNEKHVLCDLAQREVATGSLELLDAAASDAARAAALEPGCLRAQTTAANAWLGKGDTRRGLDYLRRAAALDPGDPSLPLRLGRLLLRAQRLPEAVAAAERLVRRYPAWSQAHLLQAEVYAHFPPGSPQARGSEAALDRAVHLDPLNAAAHARRGHLLLARGRPDEALLSLRVARSLDPQNLAILFDMSRASRVLNRVTEADTMDAEFRRRSRIETELMALEKQLAASPRDPDVLEGLLRLTTALGDRTRADRYRRLAGHGWPGQEEVPYR